MVAYTFTYEQYVDKFIENRNLFISRTLILLINLNYFTNAYMYRYLM